MDWQEIRWAALAPELTVFAATVILLIGEMIIPQAKRRILGLVSLTGILLALASIIPLWGETITQFNGMFMVDHTANVLKAILLVVTALVILGSLRVEPPIGHGEFFSLMLFSVLGTMFLASATDLIMLFIAMEMTVIPAYVLTACRKNRAASEAGIKYFLLGVVASVILLYGMTLLYGLTGETNYERIALALGEGSIQPMLIMGMIMIIVGLGFKVAAVPFHFWTPDVYEGATVPVASYLATGPKAGGFAALIHLLPVSLAIATPAWASTFAILAVLSMVLGNMAALNQSKVRRLLGYSAVAHTGYLLVGIAVAQELGYSTLIFYFFVYAIAVLGAFLVILAMTEHGFGECVTDFAGLSKRAPLLALAMAIFLFSLVGIPPFAGFMGKLFLFGAAVQGDLIWLTVIGVINSVISFGYYATIIRQMYLVQPERTEGFSIPVPLFASIMLIMAVVVILGFYPGLVFNLIVL